jgi:hypothetical protein
VTSLAQFHLGTCQNQVPPPVRARQRAWPCRVGDPAMLRAQELLRAAEACTPVGRAPPGGGSRGPEGLRPGPPEALQVQAPQMSLAGATTTHALLPPRGAAGPSWPRRRPGPGRGVRGGAGPRLRAGARPGARPARGVGGCTACAVRTRPPQGPPGRPRPAGPPQARRAAPGPPGLGGESAPSRLASKGSLW